jgi:DNA-binding NarL/FixJ family response regulator
MYTIDVRSELFCNPQTPHVVNYQQDAYSMYAREGIVERSETLRRPLVVAVDDDPEILRSLGRALRREPYEFLATEHPGDVLRWICARPVDLVIADQRMPEMNGTDLLEVVRDYSPDTACMILSGFPDTALIVEGSGLRIERLMAKPWDNMELTQAIRRILAERTPRKAAEVTGLPSTPPPLADGPARAQVVLNCAGREARDVIAEILPICSRAKREGSRPIILLAQAPLLRDSLSRLLKGLARAVAWSRVAIDLRDDSGYVASFVSALARRAPARR